MRTAAAIAALAATIPTAAFAASWSLSDYYDPASFTSDEWVYYTETDPTAGLVTYQSLAGAQALNLVETDSNGSFVMKVDTTKERLDGRPSVRITSAKSYGDGVYVLNASHYPTGCAVWPSWWTVTSNIDAWPVGGEIDIMESVNDQYTSNLASLHTDENCVLPATTSGLGTVAYTNCSSDTGCRIEMNNTSGAAAANTGSAFNAAGGGLYAMERSLSSTGTGIRVWFFPPGSEPDDLKNNATSVNPDNWGQAGAVFPVTSCSSQFDTHNIIFTMTLCGTWAGTTYTEVDTCVQQFGSCSNQVAYNGSSFDDAYWAVNYVKVFAKGGGSDNANVTGTTTQLATSQTATSGGSASKSTGTSGSAATSGGSRSSFDPSSSSMRMIATTAVSLTVAFVATWALTA